MIFLVNLSLFIKTYFLEITVIDVKKSINNKYNETINKNSSLVENEYKIEKD